MSGWKWNAVRGMCGALLVFATFAEPALAAPTDLGANLGNLIKTFGAAILLPVAGVAGLSAFGNRDFGKLITIMIVSTGLGGFLFKPEMMRVIIEGIWQTVAA